MQRGKDAEIAAKLEQQELKQVSDQQWHLSVVKEVGEDEYASKLL
jgi:hypothetical protein